MEEIYKYKNDIIKQIILILSKKKLQNKYPLNILEILEEYILRGKMIRGSLFLSACSFISKKNSLSNVNIACALEFFQAGLLIHDDIMDDDTFRRGIKTIHKQYEDIAILNENYNPEIYGKNIATCAGDICFFIAYELLSISGQKFDIKAINLISEELQTVGIGQMLDIEYSSSKKTFLLKDIIVMYVNKTARYTFSLPLSLAGILNSMSEKKLKALEVIGENIGILFQIRDDFLGVFGDTKITGKSNTTDLKEKKKTVYLTTLLNTKNSKIKLEVENLLSKKNISDTDLITYRELLSRSKTIENIDEYINKIITNTKVQIYKNFKDDSPMDKLLLSILDFVTSREK